MSSPILNPEALERRTWHYIQSPAHFEVAACSCGNADTQWSEFRHHVWCDPCQKDFVPEHNGVFDGPIPIGVATMLGLNFDRFNMETGKVERLNHESAQYEDAAHV